jgi:hypothetical protein
MSTIKPPQRQLASTYPPKLPRPISTRVDDGGIFPVQYRIYFRSHWNSKALPNKETSQNNRSHPMNFDANFDSSIRGIC